MYHTPLPIGIDDFEKIREQGYYYVDKTQWIKEILDKKGEVDLFTRPRRFGKTLNLSMLQYFFEKPIEEGRTNVSLFKGLKIMEAGEQYTKEQEQYPVITLTLKSAKQENFDLSYKKLRETIANEYRRHENILTGPIGEKRREKFIALRDETAEYSDYLTSLAYLSDCLFEFYQKKVIILIDEYDVPLENAYYANFYDKMISFIRSLFESVLKTNPYMEFAVITGCLRISKESIFTGLNNLEIISILNKEYGEYFGFTEEEVRQMLQFYDLKEKMDTMQRWYNGYLFGNVKVYNPWSVINYVKQLRADKNAFPTASWSNTSSNSIVRDLIYRADHGVREEIELLVNGGTIEKCIHEDVTYQDVYQSEDNLWNFLLFTGYLKVTAIRMEMNERYVTLAIPNIEVNSIYQNTILNWFREEVKTKDLTVLYAAMLDGRTELFQEQLQEQLRDTISYMDSKEAFYHGFLLGILANLEDYRVKSNREAGNGRYDICVYSPDETRAPVILELKVSGKFKEMEADTNEALEQIEEKQYDSWLPEEGYTESIRYGIAFYKKKCRIKMKRKVLEI